MKRFLLIGLALYTVGVGGWMAMGRHNEVVSFGDRLCDRVDSYFGHCYSVAPDRLLPRPEPLPSAPPSSGGCWGLCERGDLPRPPGTPELDVWTTADCSVQAVELGGRFSATPFGYTLLWSPALAVIGLLMVFAGLRRRRPERAAGVDRLAAAVGSAPMALLAALVVTAAIGQSGPSWLFSVAAAAGGLALLGVVASLGIVLVAAIRRRRAGRPGSGGRPWLEAALSAGLIAILPVAFIVVGAAHIFGC